MTPVIRFLTPADIPAAMRLKEAAGWNQTETDWRNLLRIAPETCFGLECEGVLAATATAVCYDRSLAWIGMVLTDPGHRRRGFGRRLMEHTLAVLAERQVAWIKLDATELGAPLYRALGFEEEAPVERWSRLGPPPSARPLAQWAAGDALDQRAFGADRSALLEILAPLGSAAIPGDAYAMARPGTRAAYFGPCVSRSPEAARELLGWFLATHPHQAVFWDLLPGNAEAVRLARALGFQPVSANLRAR